MEKSLHISAETLDFCSEANPLADALKFFVEFAQADLEQLAPRGWDELREKLTTVLGTKRQNAKRTALRMSPRSRVDIRVLKRPFPWAYPEEEFRTLQCEIQGLLKRAVDGRGGMAKLSEDVAIAAGHDPASERKVLEIVGSVRGAALMVLVMELWRESGAPIRRCPECDRLFYRVRKQRYCNRSCVNAANMRTWLKTAKGQRYLAKKYDAGGWQRGKRKPRTTRHRRVEFGFVDLSKVVG